MHAEGAGVVAWTANEPELVARLDAAGVDAIVSDHPVMALGTLATLERP
jgi:glycerophosphoryl diester phosphodiesterase